jgi:hypothetical protein
MQRLLVVGAGASFAETQAARLPDELCLPLMSNFAQKMWRDFNPVVLLTRFLKQRGIQVGTDPREVFFALELTRTTEFNVELFFEFAHAARTEFSQEWRDLLYHGLLNPLIFILARGLWKDSIVACPLRLAPRIASKLLPGDAVLDLNYDTLFEIGAVQAGHDIVFLPNEVPRWSLAIAKPHGSLNMIVNEERRSFAFGKLDWPGSPQPADGSANYIGFLPPRLNKNYATNPAATMILEPLRGARPNVLTFWGVGFKVSDQDLVELYRSWSSSAEVIEVINPDARVADYATAHFGRVVHYVDVEEWWAATQ